MPNTLERDTLQRLSRLPLPPTMAALLRNLMDRVGVRPGYFSHPLALPVLDLPRWLGAPDAVLPDLAFAGATGYLAVRAQDDLIDDGIGDPGEVALLSTLLLHHHDAALAAFKPGPVFWTRAAQTWAAYGEAMLVERRLHHGTDYTEADFDGVLDRSRPLALPTAAWLCSENRTADLPMLDALVSDTVRIHQLHTDLLDLEKDCAAGRRTWLLARLGDPPDTATLRRVLFTEGGFEVVLTLVRGAFTDMADRSRTMHCPAGVSFAEMRLDALNAAAARVQEAFFRTLLGM